ncbi:MAG: FprA family A-type flavoprotein [Eubacteriales bacterium]|nr:FprA family A-type flavoprotein [Eubacteriales bacterium]
MIKLTDKIYYVGVKDPNLKVFDIIMDTEFGTTYNSYIVKGEKTALIETAHDKLCDEYIKNIEEVVAIKDIDYIICNHTEPDHTGALEKILRKNPDVTVIGTIAALKNLKRITNVPFKELLAKDGDTLDLGGLDLKFIIAPNLHWPDTMMTYCESEKALFSCDVLGAHYCFDGVLDTDITNKADYEKAMQHYYNCIVSPFNSFVQKGLEKLAGLDISIVCNSHGPVLKEYIAEGLEKYQKWSAPVTNTPKKAAIFYVSAYGYTEKLAKTVFETLKQEGLDTKMFDLVVADKAEVNKALHTADLVMLGTPTINRNALKPIWDIVSSIDVIAAKDKAFAVFGSYGWSGEGTVLINTTLKNLRLKTEDEPFKVVFNPTNADLADMKEFTLNFVKKNLGE